MKNFCKAMVFMFTALMFAFLYWMIKNRKWTWLKIYLATSALNAFSVLVGVFDQFKRKYKWNKKESILKYLFGIVFFFFFNALSFLMYFFMDEAGLEQMFV